jgi:hypothetical protein
MVRRRLDGVDFVRSARLITTKALSSDFTQIPDEPGVYAWFFRTIPPRVPVGNCLVRQSATLLYTGIAPRKRLTGIDRTRRTLRTRLQYHLTGNLSGSTLRHTLAALLAKRHGLQAELRHKGRITLADNERWLTAWIYRNAYVCWVENPTPWILEHQMMSAYFLPLNLAGNPDNSFKRVLSQLRKDLRLNASVPRRR